MDTGLVRPVVLVQRFYDEAGDGETITEHRIRRNFLQGG